jgi:hypothetical protein
MAKIWTFGVDEFSTKQAVEAGIVEYIRDEFANRDLDVISPAGVRYDVLITVALISTKEKVA